MKKNVWIITLIISVIGLTAFGINKAQSESIEDVSTCHLPQKKSINIDKLMKRVILTDFHYEVANRFATSISKEQLHQATNLFDIFPKHATEGIEDLYFTKVGLLNASGEINESGSNQEMTKAQIALLRQADYSSDFYIHGNYKEASGKENYIVYYMTVVPETEATYEMGIDALVYYLKENSKQAIEGVKKEKLKPGKIRFTVDTTGKVNDVRLDDSSGYDRIDERMQELVKTIPGKWNPAIDLNGNKVNQVFVFSFGLVGC